MRQDDILSYTNLCHVEYSFDSPTPTDDDVDSHDDSNDHTARDFENTGVELGISTYFLLSFHLFCTYGAFKLLNSCLGATYNDIGDPVWKCKHYNAMMRYDERINKDKQSKNPRFALCCGDGKIQLPLLEDPPQPMRQLLFDSNSTKSKNFQANIRSYNLMFAFRSPDTKVDIRYNTGKGPSTFRIHGQGHHLIGSLLPTPNNSPKFAQLYIYDTENEVQNRLAQNP